MDNSHLMEEGSGVLEDGQQARQAEVGDLVHARIHPDLKRPAVQGSWE